MFCSNCIYHKINLKEDKEYCEKEDREIKEEEVSFYDQQSKLIPDWCPLLGKKY